MRILDEASQLRAYSHELEDKSRSLQRATDELRAANEQLKSLDHLKDDFMSSVTHELRTPLTSIRALSEMMADDLDMPAEQRQQFLRIIIAETERLSRLVNQVLDMAKIESGHAQWHTTDVDLRELMLRAVQTTAEMFRERGAAVVLDLPESVPTLRADPDRLTAGAVEPAVQRRQVPAAGRRAGRRAAAGARVRAAGRDPATTAAACRRPAGADLREVPPGRRRREPAAGHGPGPADQPPDRRALRRPDVARVRSRAGAHALHSSCPGRPRRRPGAERSASRRTQHA